MTFNTQRYSFFVKQKKKICYIFLIFRALVIIQWTLFNADTPLSALFRENHHEELRKIIESWRPYLIDDDSCTDALALTRFEFDKDRIYSNKVYRDLCGLDIAGALKVPLSQLARYLTDHSNLSHSYATLYQQLKYYRSEWT